MKLAARADVLVEKFRAGQLERLRLGPDDLHAVNPGLVIARISGYGQDGPYRDKPAFGAIGGAIGGIRHLTPERSMEIQAALGADVAMAFDHVVPGQASHDLAEEGMERTLRWLDRCRTRHESLGGDASRQTVWPIIQGGTHEDLRLRSLEGILARGPWTGVAIGGLPDRTSRPRGI